MINAFEPFVPIVDTDIATFDDGSADADLVKLDAVITPVQAGSGTPAPDNVRAITGFTGADAYVAGRNMLDIGTSLSDWWFTVQNGTRIGSTLTSITAVASGTVDPETGSITITDYNTSGYRWGAKELFLKKNTDYKMLVAGFKVCGFNSLADGTWGDTLLSNAGTFNTGDYEHIVISFYPDSFSKSGVMVLMDADDETEYAPYVGDTYPIDWTDDAGTVYGGSINFTTGELIVTHAAIDMGDKTWTHVSANETFYTLLDSDGIVGGLCDLMCEALAIWPENYVLNFATSYPNNVIGKNSGETNKYVYVHSKDYADSAAFTEAFTGVKLVFELETPLIYELTPVEVKTLEEKGVNNVWVSTGKIIELYYPIDIDFIIRRRFMVNSGYILLDCGDIDLTETDPQLITGSWDRIVTAMETCKPIWAFNTKYGAGKPLSPVPVFAWYLSDTTIVIVGATLHIIVSNNDYCVVQDVASA